jgi:hypothetical protein
VGKKPDKKTDKGERIFFDDKQHVRGTWRPNVVEESYDARGDRRADDNKQKIK